MQATRIGRRRESRRRRGKADPRPQGTEDQRGRHRAEALGKPDPDHRSRADPHPDDEGRAATHPVRVATGDRGKGRLDSGTGDEAGGDQRVATSELVDAQGHQHLHCAEHQRWDRDKAGRDEDRAADDRRRHLAQRLALRGRCLGETGGKEREHCRDPQHGAEDRFGADLCGNRPQERADQGAGDRHTKCRADHRAAALRRGL